jgi:hypothetical protein
MKGSGMIRGENRCTRRQNCPIVSLFTAILTWTKLGLNLDFRGEMSVTNLT